MTKPKIDSMPVEKQFELLKKQSSEFNKDARRVMRVAEQFFRRTELAVKELKREMQEHRKILDKITFVNSCAEETLCNVLHAIRQHEYLQAWHPKKDGK